MTYLTTGFIVVWIAVLVFLVGRALNFSRLALNNIIPGKYYWDRGHSYRYLHSFIFARLDIFWPALDPTNLNEVGRQYRKHAIRIEWITLAWVAGEIGPLVWACSYLMAP